MTMRYIATATALVLTICGVTLMMPDEPGMSECCATVGSIHPQIPVSLLAVLPPTILVAWLFAMSLALFQALDRRLQFPGPRLLCLLC